MLDGMCAAKHSKSLQYTRALPVRWVRAPTIGGAAHAAGTPVQDVGVDHRGAHVPMAEQFLDGPDVVAVPIRSAETLADAVEKPGPVRCGWTELSRDERRA